WKREIANDFTNWRINTSFRLLGMPHRKKSAVTRTKGRRCPAGKSLSACSTVAEGLDMSALDKLLLGSETGMPAFFSNRKNIRFYCLIQADRVESKSPGLPE